MSYTYTEPTGDTFADAVSEVRYKVGDKTPTAPFSLSDSEIQFELSAANGDRNIAAANVAFQMATAYLSQSTTSKSVGNTSLSKDYAGAAARLQTLSRQLREGVGTGRVARNIYQTETPVQFYIGQFDNRG